MKYLNILLIILPFIFSCSSDTPENDKEKIPPIIDTSIRVGTFNVDVGQTATAEEIALSLKSFYLDILSLEECPILIDKNSGVEEFYSIIGKALGMESVIYPPEIIGLNGERIKLENMQENTK